jgi:hypothetical protein
MQDTSEAASRRYKELLRSASPLQRLEQAARLTQAVRELAIAGIRERHPTIQDDEVAVRLAVRLYGRETAARLFGPLPDDAI